MCKTRNRRPLIVWQLLGILVMSSGASAQDGKSRFEPVDMEGVTAMRDGSNLFLTVDDGIQTVTLPRLAAPIRRIAWDQDAMPSVIKLNPGTETWRISWESRPAGAKTLIVSLEAEPLVLDELEPIVATGDGSLFFPAHRGKTFGEKLRYEPQSYKNTVGYWTVGTDYVTWKFRVDLPGRYNVAILQGCGQGQGGSLARLSVQQKDSDEAAAELDFRVLETGHFQNFQWRHLGEIELTFGKDAFGKDMELKIVPLEISKKALMDVRAIHLVRLPAS